MQTNNSPISDILSNVMPLDVLKDLVVAHGQKKQSTGSTKKSGDSHMRQYKNTKKGNKTNSNKKKGADERRKKHKPID